MRAVVIALMLLAGATAMPQLETQDSPVQEKIVGDIVAGILENVSQQIKEAGLDPYTVERFGLAYELPVPVLFSISALIEDAVVSGVSNIVINNIDYGILTGRLRLDISLPELAISLGGGSVESVVLGSDLGASVRGRLAIIEPRIFGEVRVSYINLAISQINLEFDLGGIQFDGNVNILGVDLSDYITELANYRIPAAIRDHRNEINELIEIVAWQVLEQIL